MEIIGHMRTYDIGMYIYVYIYVYSYNYNMYIYYVSYVYILCIHIYIIRILLSLMLFFLRWASKNLAMSQLELCRSVDPGGVMPLSF
jgi:hypothetical protein